MLLVDRVFRDELVRYLRIDLGLTGSDHVRDAPGRIPVDRVAPPKLFRKRDLGRIGVSDRDAPDSAATIEKIDRAPIGEAGDRKVSDVVEGGLVVERGGEQRAGFG